MKRIIYQSKKYVLTTLFCLISVVEVFTQVKTDIGSFDNEFRYENITSSGNYYFTLTQAMCISVDTPNPNPNSLEYGNFALFRIQNETSQIQEGIKSFGDFSYFPFTYNQMMEAGTYWFYISFPGHQKVIIEGKLCSVVPVEPIPQTSVPTNPKLAPSTENQIITFSYTKEGGEDYLESIQFFDGLGSITQMTQKRQTPQQNDLTTFQSYDGFYRKSYTWLPFIHSGETTVDIRGQAADQSPYQENRYEKSTLNRTEYVFKPGIAWHGAGHVIRKKYLTSNHETDNLQVLNFHFSHDEKEFYANLFYQGIYNRLEFAVEKETSEDGNVTYTFKDTKGKTLLIRNIVDLEQLDTYFFYDQVGNLLCVVPPMLTDIIRNKIEEYNKSNFTGNQQNLNIKKEDIDRYAYIYEYDVMRRCTYKKIPGAAPIYYVYDAADRLIFTQDGEQRKQNSTEWTFALPDIFGRTVLTGTVRNSAIQRDMYIGTNIAVKASFTGEGNFGYSISGYSFIPSKIYSVNYYDNYHFKKIAEISSKALNFDTSKGATYDNRYGSDLSSIEAKGLLTGTVTAVFDANASNFIYSAMYYDYKGQLIQTQSTSHLDGGKDSEYIAYNFVGQPSQKQQVHSATGKTTQTEVYSYSYDYAGRLTDIRHKLNTGGMTLIASNTYDELGRLKTNMKGNNSNMKTTYDYNLRSWTTKISSPLFTQNLHYNTVPQGSSVTPQYGGNISAMTWKVGSEAERKYGFTYDELGQLKEADYMGVGNYNTSYSYDLHGNILSIKRGGQVAGSTYNTVDNLTLTYDGNQLYNVHDSGTKVNLSTSVDFKDYALDATMKKKEYSYNLNGAMTQDLNKGISSIQYSSLNLPTIMDIKSPVGEARNEYTYSASGQKLKVLQKWNPNYSTSPIIGSGVIETSLTTSLITDYVGNKIYENGVLKRILIEGGYIEGGVYHYYLTDHLGNNRMVINASGGIIQKTHYYPFGMAFGDQTGIEKQPYKYNGKELDTKHGLNTYDYAARYMDPAIGRFTSIDPLAEKYYSISPYAYVANNPLNAVDLRGDSITLAGMQGLDTALGTNYTGKITNDVQSQTGLTITVGANGVMTYAKDANGNPIIATTTDANGNVIQSGSATARNLMVSVMDHANMVTVVPGRTSGVPPGTNTIGLNYKQIEGFISGTVGMDNRTLGWGMTLIHEVHHTNVGGGLPDAPYNPGPVVNSMNTIRSELNSQGGNYGQRLEYFGTPIGSNVYLPFNSGAQSLINSGIIPAVPSHKFIKFTK